MESVESMSQGQPKHRLSILGGMKASYAALLASAMVLAATGSWRDGPRRVGERFLKDNLGQGNPIQTVAVGFILIAIALVIALTILPVITSAVETAATDGNISASQATLLRLLPTLLIVGLLGGGVVFLFQGFRNIRGA